MVRQLVTRRVKVAGPGGGVGFETKVVRVGLSRRTINKQVGRIKRVFRWAVAEQLADPAVYAAVRAAAGLKKHRTAVWHPAAASVTNALCGSRPFQFGDCGGFVRPVGHGHLAEDQPALGRPRSRQVQAPAERVPGGVPDGLAVGGPVPRAGRLVRPEDLRVEPGEHPAEASTGRWFRVRPTRGRGVPRNAGRRTRSSLVVGAYTAHAPVTGLRCIRPA